MKDRIITEFIAGRARGARNGKQLLSGVGPVYFSRLIISLIDRLDPRHIDDGGDAQPLPHIHPDNGIQRQIGIPPASLCSPPRKAPGLVG